MLSCILCSSLSLTCYSTELQLRVGLICAMEYLICLQSRTSPTPSRSLELQWTATLYVYRYAYIYVYIHENRQFSSASLTHAPIINSLIKFLWPIQTLGSGASKNCIQQIMSKDTSSCQFFYLVFAFILWLCAKHLWVWVSIHEWDNNIHHRDNSIHNALVRYECM